MASKQKKRTWGFDRKQVVTVRFSEGEKRRVQARAVAAGLSLSAFIREAALHEKGARAAAPQSVSGRLLRHRLRRVHTGLQQALLHAQAETGTGHLRQAMTLLSETIREI